MTVTGTMIRSSQGLKRPERPGFRVSIRRPAPTSVNASRMRATKSRVPTCAALMPMTFV